MIMPAKIAQPLETLSTSYTSQFSPSPTDVLSPWLETPHEGTNIIINITSNDGGSTGKGILIGMLSAFGSAAFVVLIFAIFYFFRHTSRGRIFLDRIGRPGEHDDEQTLAREEAEALEGMDDLQRDEYLRAKGTNQPPITVNTLRSSFVADVFVFCSFYSSQPTRDDADRHLAFPVLSNTREGGLGVGI